MAESFKRKDGIFNLVLFIGVAAGFLGLRSGAEPTSDKQALIDFISRIRYGGDSLDWNSLTPACNWTGVICDTDQNNVYELRLPGVGLVGEIPDDTIGRLTQLRVLSLRSNRLSGPVPSDFGNLTSLKVLFLQGNRISGSFPECLTKLTRLSRIDISSNQFDGIIPASISNLVLKNLFLQKNRFSGAIPATLNTSELVGFDVSNNYLTGEIPATLAKFPESSFSGNLQLCGKPLPPCDGGAPSPSPSPSPYLLQPPLSGKRFLKLTTGAILVAIFVALFLLSLLLICFIKRRNRGASPSHLSYTTASATTSEAGDSAMKEEVPGDVSRKQKLVFFEPNKYDFELDNLLKASAEVLGKGSTGTSYKAEMDDGTTVVVKRLKDVVVGKKEFELQMALLLHLGHENLVKLVAYYCSKDEKLLISNFVPVGSLSCLLHGNRDSGRPALDWATRFRIGLTAARGLHYLHTASETPHGNIKSSNILVSKSLEARISDYGMHTLFGPCAVPNRVAGYSAPEIQLQQAKMVSLESDVYSFGVVLLEILTGKAPNQVASVEGDGLDLPRWVRTTTEEVFDPEVLASPAEEEEMVAVLQVAMKCVEMIPETRPEMGEVVMMLEMVERGEIQSPLDPNLL